MLRVTVAPLVVLAVLFGIPGHRALGSAYSAGTANGGGTILFERQTHWYTIAPNGGHPHMLLPETTGCTYFWCAVFSPDSSQVMVAAQAPDKKRITVAIVNTNGTGYHRLPLPTRTMNFEPGAWLPQGNRIAVHGWDTTNKQLDGIYELNASDGSGFRRLTTSPDGRVERPLLFSPDGSRLLVYHEREELGRLHTTLGDLLVTSAGGTGTVQLNPSDTRVWRDFGGPGTWSPDGRQVSFTAFSTPMDGTSAVFVANADGSHVRRITAWGAWSTSARWSPDGTWILFDKFVPAFSDHNLFLVHPNGTGLKDITSTAKGTGCCAIWSPTGSRFLTGAGGYLATFNSNGSGLKKLTPAETKVEAAEIAWGR
jgi:Tol biopolymer transport system component